MNRFGSCAGNYLRCGKSAFWDWNHDSRFIFWRWTKEFRKETRDRTKVFISGELPDYTQRQKWSSVLRDKEDLEKKLNKVRDRGYTDKGYVKSLTGYFAVPKGNDGIRMVHDATKSGLNDSV